MTTHEPGIVGYEIFLTLWPGDDKRCLCIASPAGRDAQVAFTRKRLRDHRRKGQYPQAKVVVNPIHESEIQVVNGLEIRA